MPNNLKKLLNLYRAEVRNYLLDHNRLLIITIKVDDKFLKECEDRIIEGHKKYGDDWKSKDCIREIDFEKFDIFNYKMLDGCQKRYKARARTIGNLSKAG